MILQIKNNGAEIVSTTYWDSDHAKHGLFYLTINSGAFRVLVPDCRFEMLADIINTQYVVITRGPCPSISASDAYEIMFEDESNSPYAIHISAKQCDRTPTSADVNKKFICSVWHRSGKAYQWDCYYRTAKKLPCMKPYTKGRLII